MSILKRINNKTNYKSFGEEVKFKRYFHGVNDVGTCLLSKLPSGTHGLNEELSRHEIEKVSVSVICAVRTVKVFNFFLELPSLFRVLCIIFRAFKKECRKII